MKNPICPHCQVELARWLTPTYQFADGLGFCTPWLYVCFNDECKMFVASFDYMKKSFGQKLGYRYMRHPDSGECASIPVGSAQALRGDIIDEEKDEQEELQRAEKTWRSGGGE